MRDIDMLLIVLLTLMTGVWVSVIFNFGGIVQTFSAIFHWMESLR